MIAGFSNQLGDISVKLNGLMQSIKLP
jgi:hypothetical protein